MFTFTWVNRTYEYNEFKSNGISYLQSIQLYVATSTIVLMTDQTDNLHGGHTKTGSILLGHAQNSNDYDVKTTKLLSYFNIFLDRYFYLYLSRLFSKSTST